MRGASGSHLPLSLEKKLAKRNIKSWKILTIERAVAQTNHLPFDRSTSSRLRASGDILKSYNFSAHAEPSLRLGSGHLEKPFILSLSKENGGSASGSGSAPEGLLPRRESLWLGEGRLVEA